MQGIAFAYMGERRFQSLRLAGVDARLVDLLQGVQAVYMAMVHMGDEDVADIQPVVLYKPQQSFVEHGRVDQHGVSRTVRTDQVGVGEMDHRKIVEQSHGWCAVFSK